MQHPSPLSPAASALIVRSTRLAPLRLLRRLEYIVTRQRLASPSSSLSNRSIPSKLLWRTAYGSTTTTCLECAANLRNRAIQMSLVESPRSMGALPSFLAFEKLPGHVEIAQPDAFHFPAPPALAKRHFQGRCARFLQHRYLEFGVDRCQGLRAIYPVPLKRGPVPTNSSIRVAVVLGYFLPRCLPVLTRCRCELAYRIANSRISPSGIDQNAVTLPLIQ